MSCSVCNLKSSICNCITSVMCWSEADRTTLDPCPQSLLAVSFARSANSPRPSAGVRSFACSANRRWIFGCAPMDSSIASPAAPPAITRQLANSRVTLWSARFSGLPLLFWGLAPIGFYPSGGRWPRRFRSSMLRGGLLIVASGSDQTFTVTAFGVVLP